MRRIRIWDFAASDIGLYFLDTSTCWEQQQRQRKNDDTHEGIRKKALTGTLTHIKLYIYMYKILYTYMILLYMHSEDGLS